MGNGPNKKKINNLLEQSLNYFNLNEKKLEYKYDKIKFKKILKEIEKIEKKIESNPQEDDEFWDLDVEYNYIDNIKNSKLDVKYI